METQDITIDVIERQKLYEKTINEILVNPPVIDDEIVKTSMYISDGVKSTVTILADEYDLPSWLQTMRLVTEHGFNIVMFKYKDQMKEIERLLNLRVRMELNRQQRMILKYIFTKKFNFRIKEIENDLKMTVKIQSRYYNALGKYSNLLMINQSEFLRTCIWHSIASYDQIPNYIKGDVDVYLSYFDDYMNEFQEDSKYWNVHIPVES